MVDPNFAWMNDMLQGNVQDNPFNTTFNQQGQQQQQQADQQMFMQTMIQTTTSATQSISPISSNIHHHVDQPSFTSQPTPTTSTSIMMDTPNKKRRTMPVVSHPSQPNTDHQDLRINSFGNEHRTNAADQLSNASTTPEGTLSPATPSLLAIDEKNQRRPSRRPTIHHAVSAPSTSSTTDISNVGATNIATTTTTTTTTTTATTAPPCPKEYASMTRQELIARLVELEQEKRISSLQSSPVTPGKL